MPVPAGFVQIQQAQGLSWGDPGSNEQQAAYFDKGGFVVENLIDKGGQVYNVKAYGAKGNGSANDTAAFISAIVAANGNVPVYVPAGTYLLDPITVSIANTVIRGAGRDVVTLQMTNRGNGVNAAIFTLSADRITLDGMLFDGNGTTVGSGNYWSGTVAVSGGSDDCIVQNCKFQNTARTALYANGQSVSVNRLLVSHCDFTNIGTPNGGNTGGSCVMFDGGVNDSRVLNCYAVAPLTSDFVKIQGSTVTCVGNLIQGNTVDYTANSATAYDTTEHALGIEPFNGAYYTRVIGNTIYGPTTTPSTSHVWGISCGDARFSTVMGNTVIGASSNPSAMGFGIEVAECPHLTVVGNTIQNVNVGMNATNNNPSPSHAMSIVGNQFFNCVTYGFTSDSGPDGIKIADNSFIDCGVRYIFLNSTNHISRQISIHDNTFRIKDQTVADTGSQVWGIYIVTGATSDVVPADIHHNSFGPFPGGASTLGMSPLEVNNPQGIIFSDNRGDGARPSDGAATAARMFNGDCFGIKVWRNYARNFASSFGFATQSQANEAYDNDIGSLTFASATPTAAAGANNGTSPPAPVVAAGGDTRAGTLTFGSGSGPAAGAQCVVTFTWQMFSATAAVVTLTPLNTATQALGLYVSSFSATGFTISSTNAPSASQGNTIYSVGWTVTKP